MALAALALWHHEPIALHAFSILFGPGFGNLISLPSLIVQVEFPAADFARTVRLVVAMNQFAFVFGPGTPGLVHDLAGDYGAALVLYLIVDLAAAVVLLRPGLTVLRESQRM